MAEPTMSTKNWVNIFLLGGGFLMIFTAFQTTAFVQSITIDSFLAPKCNNDSIVNINASANDHYIIDGGIHINKKFSERIGYISLCIIYLMVAIGNWVSVPIVAVFGAKWACVFSGGLYVLYIIALVRPYVPVIFLGAFVLGSAGGVLWTAQGQLLIQNSTKARMSMTSGIFWFMLQCSLIVGNAFVSIYLYFRVGSKECIPRTDNYIIFGVFSMLGVIGTILLAFIEPMQRKNVQKTLTGNVNASIGSDSSDKKPLLTEGTEVYVTTYETIQEVWTSLRMDVKKMRKCLVINFERAIRMLFSVELMLLSVCFIYTGYELNFWSGVYGTMIGHTSNFSRFHIGLAGFFIGVGEILGGGLFGILGKYTNKFGKDPVVLLGMLVHFTTYLLIYYNLPANSIADNSSDSGGALFDHSNIYIAMLCAFLLGFGDACYNTQIYAIIGTLYPSDEKSAPAMALFKFFQSMAAMVGFVTSTFILLKWQLLVLVVLATLGTLMFALVEWMHYKPSNYKNQ